MLATASHYQKTVQYSKNSFHGIIWPHEQDFSSDTIIWDIQNAQQSGPADVNSEHR